MRTIKFRAWDKVTKKMVYKDIQIVQTDWGKGFGVYVNLMNVEDLEGKNGNRLQLLEWTGLKDKNGKEIFEGDILKSWSNLLKVKVDWLSGGFWFVAIHNENYKDIEPTVNNINEFEFEVIGNIYENPDLI